jgi:hypothetical protein
VHAEFQRMVIEYRFSQKSPITDFELLREWEMEFRIMMLTDTL